MVEQISIIFGKKVIYCNDWVMVYSKDSLSEPLQAIIKAHYNVNCLTIVLKDY